MKSKEEKVGKVAERKSYVAGLIAEALPKPSESAIPWRDVAKRAAKIALSDGLSDFKFFRDDVEKVADYILTFKTPLRHIMEEELGVFVDYSPGIGGVRRAGKKGIEASARWHANLMIKMSESYGQTAEITEKIADVPSVHMKLLNP